METFQIIQLPDTQIYSKTYPEIFLCQTTWCKAQQASNNIKLVCHTGDLVDDATSDEQWINARAAMDVLKTAGCAFTRLPGNHDLYSVSDYKAMFPVSDFSGYSWFLEAKDDGLSMAVTFTVGSVNFLCLAIKSDPTQNITEPTSTLYWAKALIQAYPNHKVIFTTHNYLNVNGTRTAVGQYIWDNVIVPCPNVFLVLCGHNHGVWQRSDESSPGYDVVQLLADFQDDEEGGQGYLRIHQITV